MTVVLLVGCQSMNDGNLSYNMTQSVARSGGDVAMTALLDEGVDATQAREYVTAIAKLLEDGTLSKATLRTGCQSIATKLKLTGVADYIDALMVIVPSKVAEYQQIPPEYRAAILSFLNDGAIRALDLYKADKKPAPATP